MSDQCNGPSWLHSLYDKHLIPSTNLTERKMGFWHSFTACYHSIESHLLHFFHVFLTLSTWYQSYFIGVLWKQLSSHTNGMLMHCCNKCSLQYHVEFLLYIGLYDITMSQNKTCAIHNTFNLVWTSTWTHKPVLIHFLLTCMCLVWPWTYNIDDADHSSEWLATPDGHIGTHKALLTDAVHCIRKG